MLFFCRIPNCVINENDTSKKDGGSGPVLEVGQGQTRQQHGWVDDDLFFRTISDVHL